MIQSRYLDQGQIGGKQNGNLIIVVKRYDFIECTTTLTNRKACLHSLEHPERKMTQSILVGDWVGPNILFIVLKRMNGKVHNKMPRKQNAFV